jgi:hypothetical protein
MNDKPETSTFAPRLDILPTPQRRLWDELVSAPNEFILYGGTAIALQLGHRTSVDFDFFGFEPFNPDDLLFNMPFLKGGEVIQRDANTLTCLLDRGGPVKVSFFGVPRIGQVDEPLLACGTGFRVASLRDLAGMKANVVQLRSEAKDYLDMASLIQHGIGLSTALAAASAIYGEIFAPQIALKALSYFGDGDLSSLPSDVKRLLRHAIRNADIDRLPRLRPIRARREINASDGVGILFAR